MTIHDWFNEYDKSHQNKTNKLIHWICIPLIFWSIIALLSLIPSSLLTNISDYLHWGTVVIFFGLLFYLRLSFKIFLGMFLFSIIILVDIHYKVYFFDLHQYWGLFNFTELDGNGFLLRKAVFVFIFAWFLQFLGHKIEGKKPSFFKDIQFLLIGPAWLLGFIYNKINIKY